jgi:hypothetical protein
MVLVGGTPVEVITKRPVRSSDNGGIVYEYTSYQPTDPQFRELVQAVQAELTANGTANGFMGHLGAGEVAGQAHALPLIWTVDLVAAEEEEDKPAAEGSASSTGYHVVSMSCECVGVNKRLHLASDVAKYAIDIAADCQRRRDEEYSRE